MDAGTLRGIGTLLLLASFVALFGWAWLPRNRRRFDEASMLPLAEDRPPLPRGERR